jgi:hypothetical protein
MSLDGFGAPCAGASVRPVRAVRLEFSHGIAAKIPLPDYELRKDNKRWQVEFLLESLRVL